LDNSGKPVMNLATKSGYGFLEVQNFSMESWAAMLSSHFDLGRHIVDRTGLTGHYTFGMRWTPENTPATSSAAGRPSIFTALQEQLGLKLEPGKAMLDTVAVEHIERPTPN
jgi:uncharacterized protein (TIGR03435 family)